MRFSRIIMKLRQVGFDECYQAGSRNRFHPMNIVAESRILNLQFWVCVEGGYNVAETYHIASRPLDDVRVPTERTDFKTQTGKKEAGTSKPAPAKILFFTGASLMYRPCHFTKAKRNMLMSLVYSLDVKFNIQN